MNIVIDLDDTLYMNDVVINTLRDYNYPLTRSDIKSWDLDEIPTQYKVEIYKRWNDPFYMCNIAPIENNQLVIRNWHEKGHKIYCVTSRNKSIATPTIEMVHKDFPEIQDTFVVQGSKLNMLKELNSDLFIDDSPCNVADALKAKFNTVMISNKHTPYNHSMRDRVSWYKCLYDLYIMDKLIFSIQE